jgi:hypothetical protein
LGGVFRGEGDGFVLGFECHGGKEGAGLEKPAEIFLAGDVVTAGPGLEGLQGLISHFEPFEPDDADEFVAVLPDLALPQF